MPDAMIHPTAQELALFGQGKLPEAQAATVATHLETCPDCRLAVANLPPDSFLEKVRDARTSPTVPPAGARAAEALGGAVSGPADVPAELADHPKFRVLRELGRGGMGVIYLAEHRVFEKLVALKVINPAVLDNAGALARFQAEVKAAGKLDHPNIARAHDADQAGGLYFLVMEYVEGQSLAQLLQRKGPLSVASACRCVRQAALGLQHAFERGMAHRDIKPHNLMLTPKGQIKVLDFGLARLRGPHVRGKGLTQADAFMGTPEYVAPEQATDARQADIRADIYSLGCTLYALITGRPPFTEGTTVKLVLAHIEKPPRPLHELRPDVPVDLSTIVARMLAKDPAQRFQTPADVAQALAPFCKPGQKPVADVPPTPPSAASRNQATQMPGDTSRVSPVPRSGDRHSDTPRTTQRLAPRFGRPMKIGLGAAGLFVLLAILGGVLLTVRTRSGDVVIELNDPMAKVEVKVDGDKIEVSGLDRPLTLTAGEHGLTVTGTDFEGVAQSFTVKKGEKQIVKVTLTPKSPVAAGPANPVAPGAAPPPRPGSLAGRQAPLREQLLREGGGSEETETAVLRGLGWIVRQQRANGSWSFAGYDPDHGSDASPEAATGLALLPLLGAGHTHQTGPFAPRVDRALNFLLSKQPADGGFAGSAYQQAIPTIALCEAYVLTKDPRLKEPAQRALDFLVRAQHAGGGWRYSPGQAGDTSCTGWALIALKTGLLAGLAVPEDTLLRASRFLDEMEYPDRSGYGYDARTNGTAATCAIGLLCRMHLGWEPSDPRVRKGVETLLRNPPSPALRHMYYYYYATQVLRHVGGAPWKDWDSRMRPWLLASQSPGPIGPDGTRKDAGSRGSWSPVSDAYGKAGGRLMATSLALLTLEVYYRHVPFCLAERGAGLIADQSSQPSGPKPGVNDSLAPLFNGKDLTGWVQDGGNPGDWRVEQGQLVLAAPKAQRGWLLTEKDYSEFLLRLEFQHAADAVSGVSFYRLPQDPGFEKIAIGGTPDQPHGPLLGFGAKGGLPAASPPRLKPSGSWNEMEVEVKARSVRASVNGHELFNTTLEQLHAWAPQVAAFGRTAGRIALQDHTGTVRFRNIRIKELSTKESETLSDAPALAGEPIRVTEKEDTIQIDTDALQVTVRKKGYVSGIAAGTFLDRKTGAHALGFGLHIMDFLLAPGWRDDGYSRDVKHHGRLPKHYVEGPQICTQAKELNPKIVRGRDFVAIKLAFTFTKPGDGYKAGSTWEQTLVFLPGVRYILSGERITSVNAVDDLFYRIDMPGHIKHKGGDDFEQVYLSYLDKPIPASEFQKDFAPDARYLYQRREGQVPGRMIRAYQVKRDGKQGPWLAGMTLDPAAVSEAWCHERGYVCFIEELHGRKVKAGETFGAAYIVGWFDDVTEMETVYDRYKGKRSLVVEGERYRLE